eukprot:TRINITY_DN930_c0_g1_i5.p1 TRINITY_DN930_c0_g1~~TRINITY_DN930_c0_g1_i5.p1  ORF type:complete len:187 (-),score=4.19 TRINITY_DN930_c0_g1_i5:7-567(-)
MLRPERRVRPVKVKTFTGEVIGTVESLFSTIGDQMKHLLPEEGGKHRTQYRFNLAGALRVLSGKNRTVTEVTFAMHANWPSTDDAIWHVSIKNFRTKKLLRLFRNGKNRPYKMRTFTFPQDMTDYLHPLTGQAVIVVKGKADENSPRTVLNVHRAVFQLFYSIPPCLLYTSPSPRDRTRSRMPSSA